MILAEGVGGPGDASIVREKVVIIAENASTETPSSRTSPLPHKRSVARLCYIIGQIGLLPGGRRSGLVRDGLRSVARSAPTQY
ncbi:hypothetical protein CU668_03905 [Pseudomonas syringae pv. actinidifoliorum]|nr:hypothetical protein [Pseudomonas syringae pv. actinidifoliorum]